MSQKIILCFLSLFLGIFNSFLRCVCVFCIILGGSFFSVDYVVFLFIHFLDLSLLDLSLLVSVVISGLRSFPLVILHLFLRFIVVGVRCY